MGKPRTLLGLFSSPKRWTKGAYARTARNKSCTPNSSSAVKFCLLGGIQYLGDTYLHRHRDCHSALQQAIVRYTDKRNKFPCVISDVVSFNDSPLTKFVDIRAVLKLAKV